MDGAGESGGGKMETIVLKNLKNIYTKKKKRTSNLALLVQAKHKHIFIPIQFVPMFKI